VIFKNLVYPFAMAEKSENAPGRPSPKQPTVNGARLAKLRQEADMSQVQLAKALGIPQRTLSFYERQANSIPSNLVPALANALEVPLEKVLGIEAPGQNQPENTKTTAKRGPVGKARQVFEQVSKLPRNQQQRILGVVEDMLSAQRLNGKPA